MAAAVDAWAPRLPACAGAKMPSAPAVSPVHWSPFASGIGPWRLRRRLLPSVLVAAAGKKRGHDGASSSGNGDSSAPKEDNTEGRNPGSEHSKSKDSAPRLHGSLSDWRDFRASLVAREQEQLLDPDALIKGIHLKEPSQRLGSKWAHPIPVPETGCVLVATEKLDGVSHFERTVVLLLRLGSRDIKEGPFGVILNRPLNKKIKHMKPANSDLAAMFADCSLYFGGPLDASMFLLRTAEGGAPIPDLETVVPGLCFGARNNLDSVGALVKKGGLRAQDLKFFVGYAGWQFDQLLDEVAEGYWVVAACSSQLISQASSDSSSRLWEEILQLMGGQYSELSRKPRQDGA